MVQVSNKNYLIIWISHNCLWIFLWKKLVSITDRERILQRTTTDSPRTGHCCIMVQTCLSLPLTDLTAPTLGQMSQFFIAKEYSFPWWKSKCWLSLKICTHCQWNITSITQFAYFKKLGIILCCFVYFDVALKGSTAAEAASQSPN